MSRLDAWEVALRADVLPDFVDQRLRAAGAGKLPWLSTTSPAELKMVRDHGIRPVTMVSGTCWLHYGYSWTEGHREGWRDALRRMQAEAVAAGAHAIVDVKLRTLRFRGEDSMDFTVFGTAVRIDGLAPSTEPVIATVPALEFVRLLKAGIVPLGLAIGAHFQWLGGAAAQRYSSENLPLVPTQPMAALTNFWAKVRRAALADLFRDAANIGDGVLAHTHFSELLFVEGKPDRFLGRVIVMGTVVHAHPSVINEMPDIWPVVDMRDGRSLSSGGPARCNVYLQGEEEGAI